MFFSCVFLVLVSIKQYAGPFIFCISVYYCLLISWALLERLFLNKYFKDDGKVLLCSFVDYILVWTMWTCLVRDDYINLLWVAFFISIDFVLTGISLLKASSKKEHEAMQIYQISNWQFLFQFVIVFTVYLEGPFLKILRLMMLIIMTSFMCWRLWENITKEDFLKWIKDS